MNHRLIRFLVIALLCILGVLPGTAGEKRAGDEDCIPFTLQQKKAAHPAARQDWSTTLGLLLKLRLYETRQDDLASLMSDLATPLEARLQTRAHRDYSLLAYAASTEPGSPAAVFLFHRSHLIRIGIIPSLQGQSFCFLDAYVAKWYHRPGFRHKELTLSTKERKNSPAARSWEQQMTEIARKAGDMKRKDVRTRLLALPGDVSGEQHSPLPTGKGFVHFYHNHTEAEAPTAYFRHGKYHYMRNASFVFTSGGKLLTMCTGIEIGHSELPEDGSTDPLMLEHNYALLPM